MLPDPFDQFLETYRQDLARISRATRGETSPQEVHAEAWLMVAELKRKGVAMDLYHAEQCQLILSRLYQRLVRYTELNVRYAVRLDHSVGGAEDEVHPLARRLAADERSDPVMALLHAEDQQQLDAAANPHQSLASAYLHLLWHLDGQMDLLARHLLISLSYCYRRCAHARSLAAHQLPLPAGAVSCDLRFVPGAWRRFRLQRRPLQMSLDFEWGETLFPGC